MAPPTTARAQTQPCTTSSPPWTFPVRSARSSPASGPRRRSRSVISSRLFRLECFYPGHNRRLRLFLGRGARLGRGLHRRGLHQEELRAGGREEEDEEGALLTQDPLSRCGVRPRIISS